MIVSTKGKIAKAIIENVRARAFSQDLVRRAQRKIQMIRAAHRLLDLHSPPGNRLEAFAGDRQGQHSIRINNQWRICFVWIEGNGDTGGNAKNVEIVDYH